MKSLLIGLLLLVSATANAAHKPYTQIVNFVNGQTIRANGGFVDVTIASNQPFQFYFDGQLITMVSYVNDHINIRLDDVSRGPHEFMIISSTSSTVLSAFVQRTHQ